MSRPPVPTRWLISDLDGVIRHWDQADFAACAAQFGLRPQQLAAVAFQPDRLAAAMRGDLPAEAWYAEIERVCALEHGCDTSGLAQEFRDLGWTIDGTVIDLLGEVRAAGTPVALFSNASTQLEIDLEASGLTDAFDVVINSSRLGHIKPDVEAFVAAATVLGTEPSACWFVDDLAANVAGAAAAGMDAVVFAGVDDLRRWLDERGLLAPHQPGERVTAQGTSGSDPT